MPILVRERNWRRISPNLLWGDCLGKREAAERREGKGGQLAISCSAKGTKGVSWEVAGWQDSVVILLLQDGWLDLRCKTPERVRNEFYMHLVGYNLIRGVMAAAAEKSGKCPREISFKRERCKRSVSFFHYSSRHARVSVRGPVDGRGCAYRRRSAGPLRGTPQQAPAQTLSALAKTSRPLHKSRRAKVLGKFKCHSTTECFQLLTNEVCKKFGDFQKRNEGFHLVHHLGWTDFDEFRADLVSLE